MTPKEKAVELVIKFKKHSKSISSGFLVSNEDTLIQSAKQCALVAVDEYISTNYYNPSVREFYEKVKQEIEKL